jgi:coniferyl-aldehyde dehydrogenase
VEPLTFGAALPPQTRKLPPTLVNEPGENLSVMCEEIFGPVLPIKIYRELDEAIDYVNRHPHPLALYYFGADPGKRDEHGEFGFQTFSHRKGVFLQSRFSGTRFLRPPFGRITDLMLKFLRRG